MSFIESQRGLFQCRALPESPFFFSAAPTAFTIPISPPSGSASQRRVGLRFGFFFK
jgi:hypothetical protein